MPERSRMYFFILETTMRTSSWSYWFESAGPPACAVTDAGRGAASWGWGWGARGGGAGRGGAAWTSWTSRISFAARASPRACSSRLGARSSTAQASRWRRVATCESQHGTEQNTRRVRLRLQVETLHTQWMAWKAMPVLQALQSIQGSAAGDGMGPSVNQPRPASRARL